MTNLHSEKAEQFSLTMGGLLYRIQTRSRMISPPRFFVGRRMLLFSLVTWLPLFVLSILERTLGAASGLALPFLYDLPVHARLLLASPLLLAAEPVVDRRLNEVVRDFIRSDIVTPKSLPAFEAAIDSLGRWRDSVLAELILFIVSTGLIFWVWSANQVDVPSTSWLGTTGAMRLEPSRAGWWYLLVAVPVSQFLFVRWIYRLGLWTVFLARLARMDLRIRPVHPDHTGGLVMLGRGQTVFAVIFHAASLVVSAGIAKRVLFDGAELMEFKVPVIGILVLSMLAIFVPLCLFGPRLTIDKRLAMLEYGQLGSLYSRLFEEKWLRGGAPAGETILGSGDVQSLADIGASYERVETMRVVPFSRRDLLMAAVSIVAPFLPLALTVMPLNELAQRLLKMVL